jgi:CheY-specific phosphatase CheX
MESLLGEVVDENDDESLRDGIAELCNIITGSVKTVFSNKNIKVTFELPKTYLSLELASNDIGTNIGVWIDMELEKKPFYMFITK